MKKSENKVQDLESQLANQKEISQHLQSEIILLQNKLKKAEQEILLFDKKILETHPLMKSLEASFQKEKKLSNDLSVLNDEIICKNEKIQDLEKSLKSEKDRKEREKNEKLENDAILHLKDIALMKSEIFRLNNKSILQNKKFNQEKNELVKIIEDLRKEMQMKDVKVEMVIDINENLIKKNDSVSDENNQVKHEIDEMKKLQKQQEWIKERGEIKKTDNLQIEDENKEENAISMIKSEELIVHESEEH